MAVKSVNTALSAVDNPPVARLELERRLAGGLAGRRAQSGSCGCSRLAALVWIKAKARCCRMR